MAQKSRCDGRSFSRDCSNHDDSGSISLSFSGEAILLISNHLGLFSADLMYKSIIKYVVQ